VTATFYAGLKKKDDLNKAWRRLTGQAFLMELSSPTDEKGNKTYNLISMQSTKN